MDIKTVLNKNILEQIIDEKLKPVIKTIDEEAYYPKKNLSALGQSIF